MVEDPSLRFAVLFGDAEAVFSRDPGGPVSEDNMPSDVSEGREPELGGTSVSVLCHRPEHRYNSVPVAAPQPLNTRIVVQGCGKL